MDPAFEIPKKSSLLYRVPVFNVSNICPRCEKKKVKFVKMSITICLDKRRKNRPNKKPHW